MVGIHAHFNNFSSILATIVFICLLLIFFAMNAHKVQAERGIALNRRNLNKNIYRLTLMKLLVCIMKSVVFVMTMQECLSVCKMAIDSGDLQEIDRIYNKVLVKANQKLRSDKYTYFDLNNIEDSALRSLIAQSIVYAQNNDVEFTLEVRMLFTRLSIDLLDLCSGL